LEYAVMTLTERLRSGKGADRELDDDLRRIAKCEIRRGKDGKIGIYSREFNIRYATFNANTYHLQLALKRVIALLAAKEGKLDA
jgi:hypothetical protein